MEFRVLQYFLAVTREQSISGAAESLHLSQPTLSRQLKDLENELGKQLIIRGNRKITLTEEGMLLRKRAEEIVDLVQRTENEIMLSDETITGDIFIGTGETDGIRLITRAAKELQKEYPGIHYHIASGDAIDVIEQIDKGLLDFGILLEPIDLSKYNYLKLPVHDLWGVLMRKDSPLANKESITSKDLWDKPLILSRQSMNGDVLAKWLKKDFSNLNIVATYNLIYNASLMVDEELGYALCLDKLINTTGESNLIFRPLNPKLEIGMYVVWKKYQVFSKAAEKFLFTLQEFFPAS
jgi:DNA-binding transcriptional LysR family regulator